MKRRARIYYTEADKALMWDRWQQGETLHAMQDDGQFARHRHDGTFVPTMFSQFHLPDL